MQLCSGSICYVHVYRFVIGSARFTVPAFTVQCQIHNTATFTDAACMAKRMLLVPHTHGLQWRIQELMEERRQRGPDVGVWAGCAHTGVQRQRSHSASGGEKASA